MEGHWVMQLDHSLNTHSWDRKLNFFLHTHIYVILFYSYNGKKHTI